MNRIVVSIALCTLPLAAVGCVREQPTPRDDIRFSHGKHLRAGAQCTSCHAVGNAGDEVEAQAIMSFPRQADCEGCHTEAEEQQCRYCHTRPQAPLTYAPRQRRVLFNHRHHLSEPVGVTGCMTCHGAGVSDQSVAAFEPVVPPMRACTDSCHAEDMPALNCSRCHTDLHDYDREDLNFIRHPAGFLQQHGPRARTSDNLCGQCHERSFCADCHRASVALPLELVQSMEIGRDFVHRGDFRSRHAAEARLDQATCLRCHGPSLCDGCHRETGIGGGVGADSPHPPGWLDPFSTQGHARAARREILTCAGCHESDAEQTCVPCHRVGSVAGNPHPPGFGLGLDPLRHGICRVCHEGTL